MASARMLLSVLGVGIAAAGIVAARFGLDPFLALGLVVVGAFLLILPFTRPRDDE
jgi:hypothetical protein